MEIRVDRIQLPVVKKTEEGYLKGEAVVTRIGVFKYINLDGTQRLELRHPDDIFLSCSLDTLKAIPITNDHPTELVNSTNISKLAVGMTGETVKVEDEAILCSINITHEDGIKAITRGKKELSLGYTLDVVEESGVYEGEEYTHRQKNVKYNHLAIVEKARAGRSARINVNLDGALISYQNNQKKQEEEMEEIQKINQRIDKIEEKKYEEKNKNEAEALQQRLDKAQATIDQLKQEISELKSVRVDSLIAEQAKKRLILLNKVSKFINIDTAVEKTEREIMELVIKSKNPDIKLDDKSESYIEGRFDAILESNTESMGIRRQFAQVAISHNDAKQEAIDLLAKLKAQHKLNRL